MKVRLLLAILVAFPNSTPPVFAEESAESSSQAPTTSSSFAQTDWETFDPPPPAVRLSSQSDISGARNPNGEIAQDDAQSGGSKDIQCDHQTYDQEVISLAFLHRVANPSGISYRDFGVGDFGEAKGGFALGTYTSACFEPKMISERVGNKIFVRIVNTYFDKEDLPENVTSAIEKVKEDRAKDGTVAQVHDKYHACLKAQGLSKTMPDGSWAIDFNKIKRKRLIRSGSVFPYVDRNGEPLSGLDKEESYQLYFASNDTLPNGLRSQGDEVEGTPPWRCANYQHISKEKPLHTGLAERLRNDVITTCQGKNPIEMLKKISDLSESDVGNAGALQDSLEKILIYNLKKEQDGILKEIKEIEERMRKLMRDKDKEDNEDDAETLAKSYRKLMDKLEKRIHIPAISLLRQLHDAHDSAHNGEEEARVAAKINKLAVLLAQFPKDRTANSCEQLPCRFFKHYTSKGEEDLSDDAIKFEELKLKSTAWSRTFKGKRLREIRGKRISPSVADRRVSKKMDKFEKRVISPWRERAAIADGDLGPIARKQQEIRREQQTLQKLSTSDPYKGLGWCKYANTQSCTRKKILRQKLIQKRIERRKKILYDKTQYLAELNGLAQQYREQRGNDANDDPFAGTYGPQDEPYGIGNFGAMLGGYQGQYDGRGYIYEHDFMPPNLNRGVPYPNQNPYQQYDPYYGNDPMRGPYPQRNPYGNTIPMDSFMNSVPSYPGSNGGRVPAAPVGR